MSAKSKRRPSKIENKLLKLEKLELKDVFCSICQSILLEPVTLPCFHDFCYRCFNGSIENNALCCPLCRLRIGSWLRTATKQKNLVNVELWNFIKLKFSREVDIKTKGEDVHLPEEIPKLRLSEPGEIRSEFEAELKRFRAERLVLELKHKEETESLVKKLQLEEEEAHKSYTQALQQDELLAQKIQDEHLKAVSVSNKPKKKSLHSGTSKPRLKATKLDGYLSKAKKTAIKESPTMVVDDTNSDSTPKPQSTKTLNGLSPEIVPSYGKLFKNIIDKKVKVGPGVWNKENGDSEKEEKDDPKPNNTDVVNEEKRKAKSKPGIPSLLVSLPLPQFSGILQHKRNLAENRNKGSGSADSMRQELCYFKPIEGTTPTSFNKNKSLPLRVPVVRLERLSTSPGREAAPSRAQYLEGLCQLRNLSLANNLPSAFVIALSMLSTSKENSTICDPSSRVKKTASTSPCIVPSQSIKRNATKNRQNIEIEGISKLNYETNLRRTRSMGSISKSENETTPKKAKIKQRKVSSERKPYLRSDSKKTNTKRGLETPPLISESVNTNKVDLAVKNLSSPLKNCDVKQILEEQLRIEKLIEQEKVDLEFALKIDAEWNGRRTLRGATLKRQVTLNYALKPSKKLKV